MMASVSGWGGEHNQASTAFRNKRTSGARIAARVDPGSDAGPRTADGSVSRS
jgi:hypothetical protein